MIQSVLPHYYDYVDRAIPGHCDSPPRYADVKAVIHVAAPLQLARTYNHCR